MPQVPIGTILGQILSLPQMVSLPDLGNQDVLEEHSEAFRLQFLDHVNNWWRLAGLDGIPHLLFLLVEAFASSDRLLKLIRMGVLSSLLALVPRVGQIELFGHHPIQANQVLPPDGLCALVPFFGRQTTKAVKSLFLLRLPFLLFLAQFVRGCPAERGSQDERQLEEHERHHALLLIALLLIMCSRILIDYPLINLLQVWLLEYGRGETAFKLAELGQILSLATVLRDYVERLRRADHAKEESCKLVSVFGEDILDLLTPIFVQQLPPLLGNETIDPLIHLVLIILEFLLVQLGLPCRSDRRIGSLNRSLDKRSVLRLLLDDNFGEGI